MLELIHTDDPALERNLRLLERHTVPVGSVALWPIAPIPEGWAQCDGTAISRADAAELFALVGTSFGAGDGSTTFNLPNVTTSVPPFGARWIIKL